MKRLITLLLTLALAFQLAVPAAAEGSLPASGECGANGNNLTWKLTKDGVLTFPAPAAWDSTDRRPGSPIASRLPRLS